MSRKKSWTKAPKFTESTRSGVSVEVLRHQHQNLADRQRRLEAEYTALSAHAIGDAPDILVRLAEALHDGQQATNTPLEHARADRCCIHPLRSHTHISSVEGYV